MIPLRVQYSSPVTDAEQQPAADDSELGTWGFRVVRYLLGYGYGLHVVYFDAAGKPWGMSPDPARFIASLDTDTHPSHEIAEQLRRAYNDAFNHTILDEYKDGEWPGRVP